MTKKQKQILIRIIITVILLLALKFIVSEKTVSFYVLFVITYILIGYDILIKAFKGIFKKQLFDENFLMSIATLGAIILKEYEEGIFVMLFYQIGEFFQSLAIKKSRNNISELMDIRPDYANLIVDNDTKIVDPFELKLDDIILIKVGEKIPVDGIVIDGNTSLNMTALTGESIPKDIKVNSEVLSGSINMESPIKVKVTKLFEESTASKILDLVENATNYKSKSENYITKFAKYYTPIVCLLALLLVIIGPIIDIATSNPINLTTWTFRALTFLVISCPCALVISIPLSFFGAIGGASSSGILIKGSNYIEKLNKTNIIAFDKTGTITKGIFEVTTIHNANISEEELLKVAAHSENLSSHPIAKSIVKEYGKEIDSTLVTSVKEISGKGILATYNNQNVIIGNEEMMKDNNIEYIKCDDFGTILHIAIDGEYKGHIHIGDKIKKNSKEAINELKKLNIEKLIMLTGDDKAPTNSLMANINIDEIHSNLLPQDKTNILIDLKNKNDKTKYIAFVGDGINDAPSLKTADVGISMGSLGSDAAIEAADIVLMDDDPLKISKAIRISRKCMRIVNENIVFAISVKIICLILSALGYAEMWLAVFSDVGVMVLAVINALRTLKVKNL